MAIGRPPKWDNAEEFEQRVNEYFADCDEKAIPYTVPGLALFLGFEDRHALLEYKGKKAFSATVKKARTRIETQRVGKLVEGKCNPAGLIFDLKNNFGYHDKSERELTGKDGGPLEITITFVRPEDLNAKG
jgi:hypothetical protein